MAQVGKPPPKTSNKEKSPKKGCLYDPFPSYPATKNRISNLNDTTICTGGEISKYNELSKQNKLALLKSATDSSVLYAERSRGIQRTRPSQLCERVWMEISKSLELVGGVTLPGLVYYQLLATRLTAGRTRRRTMSCPALLLGPSPSGTCRGRTWPAPSASPVATKPCQGVPCVKQP